MYNYTYPTIAISQTHIELIRKLLNLTKLTLNCKVAIYIDFSIDAKISTPFSSLSHLTELNLNENLVGDDGC